MAKEEPEVRILTHRITRRQAVKAGGIAALGLAFSKPIIQSIYPKPALALTATPLLCQGNMSNNITVQVMATGSATAEVVFTNNHLLTFCGGIVCAGSCHGEEICIAVGTATAVNCVYFGIDPNGNHLYDCSGTITCQCQCSGGIPGFTNGSVL